MATTSIEWTDDVWNPVRGCARVSPGCEHCYAEVMAARFSDPGMWGHGFAERTPNGPRWTRRVEPVPEKLAEPLSWRKPRRVFVNSTSDLFHEDVPFAFIAAVFGVMAATPQHTYQVLTKRAERMAAWFEWVTRRWDGKPEAPQNICDAHAGLYLYNGDPREAASGPFARARAAAIPVRWPLPNVWLGVSVEDQRRADERIPHLLRVPAVVRFLSCEPLLGPVDLRAVAVERYADGTTFHGYDALRGVRWHNPDPSGPYRHDTGRIHWVIVGGESGARARPFDLAWVRSLRDQCREAGTAFFMKQLGAAASDPVNGVAGAALKVHPDAAALVSLRLRDRKGGDPAEWPEDLRVREFPTTREEAHDGR